MTHKVGQINGPHTLCHLQLPAGSLKLLITHWLQIPVRQHPAFELSLLTLLVATANTEAVPVLQSFSQWDRLHLSCVQWLILDVTLIHTYFRTILEQAKPQSQWYSCRMTGTFSRMASSEKNNCVKKAPKSIKT